METRDEYLLALRPSIDIDRKGKKSELENFMHETLRPVLKFQQTFIQALMDEEKHIKPESIRQLDQDSRQNFLANYISKNNKVRASLIGSISGLFTTGELDFYFEQKRELDRRIIEISIVRYLSKL